MVEERAKVHLVFGSGCGLLVADDVLESHERQPIDDFGGVDQVIDIEGTVGPTLSNRDCTAVEAHDLNIVFCEVHEVAEFAGSIPGCAAADHIEVVGGLDDAADDQWPAAEDGKVAGWEGNRPQPVQQRVLVCSGGVSRIPAITHERT